MFDAFTAFIRFELSVANYRIGSQINKRIHILEDLLFDLCSPINNPLQSAFYRPQPPSSEDRLKPVPENGREGWAVIQFVLDDGCVNLPEVGYGS